MEILLITAAILILLGYLYLGIKMPKAALLSCLPVSIGIFFCGGVFDITAVMALAPGLFVGTLLVVFIGGEKESVTWPKTVSGYILFVLGLGILAVLVGIPAVLVAALPPLFILLLSILPLLIGLLVGFGLTARGGLALDLVATLNSCMRQNLPLTAALEASGGGGQDRRSRMYRRIAHGLQRGLPLSESIRRGYPSCPAYITSLVAMGERVNQLPFALAALEKDLVEKSEQRTRLRPVDPLYPFLVLTVGFFIVLGLMIFVVPKFKAIFSDMGVELPTPTKYLMELYAGSHEWLLGILAVLALLAAPAWLYTRLRPRRPERPYKMSRLSDSIKWMLPISHGFEKNYSLMRVTESLRLSLRAGCPLNQAIKYTCDLDVNHRVRRRLQRWWQRVQQGQDVGRAAAACGLGRGLVWAFDYQVNPGQAPVVLEILENFYRGYYNYRIILAQHILWPVIIALTGAAVGVVAYCLFSPMVNLLEEVCNAVMP